MKFCPTCETKYDEEILRFCIKDGTPLVDEKQPEFKEIPSETPEDDDIGEQTIIRRNKPSTPLPPTPVPTAQPPDSGTERLDSEIVQGEPVSAGGDDESDSKRIVISTASTPVEQGIRPKVSPPSEDRHKRPKKSNAPIVALLSIIGTIAVLAGAFGIYWFLSSRQITDANTNVNVNLDTNVDDNLDTNFNADDLLDNLNIDTNENTNLDVNVNANANIKTPTPTPKPTPTPTPSPSPTENANVGLNTNTSNGNGNTNVTPTGTKNPTPAPTKTPTPVKTATPSTNTNTPVNVGQINGRAVRLPTPAYSPAARQARASGRVTVRVVVDERGNVVAANATAGHPLLRKSAERAALRSRFKPVSRNGRNVKSTGTIAYNFVN